MKARVRGWKCCDLPCSLHSRVERSRGEGHRPRRRPHAQVYGVGAVFLFAESFCSWEVLALFGAGFGFPASPHGPLRAVGLDHDASCPSAAVDPNPVRAAGQADPTGAREWSRCRFRTTGGEREVMAGVWDTARLGPRARNRPAASDSGNADSAAGTGPGPWAKRAWEPSP